MVEALDLVDAMAHLEDERIAHVPAVLQRAAQAGVRDVVSAGVDPLRDGTAWWDVATPVRLWRAVGVHPQAVTAARLGAQLAAVEARAAEPRVVALGEVGLDGR